MKINDIAKAVSAEIVVEADSDIQCFYAGDFLSRVMGSAPSQSLWLTVMNNVNVAGVAVLADIRAILLCEGVKPVEELRSRCQIENISLLCTDLKVFEACVRLGNL